MARLDPALAATRKAVRDVLDTHADRCGEGQAVVVACSGGADSLALLAGTIHEGHRRSLRVVGAIVDHGLQETSAEVAERVVAQMAELGADETLIARVHVEQTGHGPEAAARRARYAVLEQVAVSLSASTVLLGHTRDDQAETVLLGLARGSGGRSIAGMRSGYSVFLRPFLAVTRAQTEAACAALGLDVWEDPHNFDPRFTRSRLRHQVLPVLEQHLGPGVAATLARTAGQLQDDLAALDYYAAQGLTAATTPIAVDHTDPGQAALTLSVSVLEQLPTAVRRRVLRSAALEAGAPPAELFHVHVMAMDELITNWRGQRWIDLPGHLRATRARANRGPGGSPAVLRIAAYRPPNPV